MIIDNTSSIRMSTRI